MNDLLSMEEMGEAQRLAREERQRARRRAKNKATRRTEEVPELVLELVG